MAMTTCRECGVEVSTDAAACANCGARRPSAEAQERFRRVGAIAAVLGLLILAALALFLVVQARDSQAAEISGRLARAAARHL